MQRRFPGIVIFMAVIVSVVSGQTQNDYTSKNIGILKYVPAGTFQRDDTATSTSRVSAFRMSRYEITRAQFKSVMGVDPSATFYSTGENDPVQQANWYHAIAFCNLLSIIEGLTPVYSVNGVDFAVLKYVDIPDRRNTAWDKVAADWTSNGYRLPTEMEWMWAAMGAKQGTTGRNKAFAGSTGMNKIGNYAWYSSNSNRSSNPAGSKLPNELGLFDMSGNVWEWIWDWYGVYPTGAEADYRGAASGSRRVRRGGGWGNSAQDCTVALRLNGEPQFQNRASGFRVVRP